MCDIIEAVTNIDEKITIIDLQQSSNNIKP